MNKGGIYIHVPYCKRKCNYCNFHFSTNFSTKDQFLTSVITEIENRKYEMGPLQIQTIYLGGGTPSILTERELNSLFETIYKNYSLTQELEITMEANPDDLEGSYILELKNTPINRLSIGVQSFFEEDLIWMNRSHTNQQSIDCLKNCLNHHFENLSIDLIYGVPSESHEKWMENLLTMKQFDIPHFSAYALTIEERTNFYHQLNTKKMQPLQDSYTMEQMDITLDFCEANGYEAYEVSNFSKPNKRAIHNSNYWNGLPYLGFGPSAHSFNGDIRKWNVANNNIYNKAILANEEYSEQETLTPENKFNEYVMLQLRKVEGIFIEELTERFPIWADSSMTLLESWVQEGYVQRNKSGYSFTRQGVHISDFLIRQLFIT
jgi:oxygen-independent coproporphyrinogen III oxidase